MYLYIIGFLCLCFPSFSAVSWPNWAPGVSPSCLALFFPQIWSVQILISLISITIRSHFWFRESGPKQQKCKMPAKAQVGRTTSKSQRRFSTCRHSCKKGAAEVPVPVQSLNAEFRKTYQARRCGAWCVHGAYTPPPQPLRN